MAARCRSAGRDDQVDTCRVVLVVVVVGWLSANEWGATTVGMWRWGEIHIHT
jgi:hypothetical protein